MNSTWSSIVSGISFRCRLLVILRLVALKIDAMMSCAVWYASPGLEVRPEVTWYRTKLLFFVTVTAVSG